MKHIVKKYPNSTTLAERRFIGDLEPVPESWETMSVEDYDIWEKNALLTWTPTIPTPELSPRIKIEPENIYLSCLPEDEIEFSKLITLLQLGINNSAFTLNTPIQIWDVDKNRHYVTVERFFQMMVQYGLYCYQLRN